MTQTQAESTAQGTRRSVLILSPPPSVHGGVSTFIEMMKPNLKNYDVTSFWIGSTHEQAEGKLATLKRLFTAPLAVAKLVQSKHFDVVHINPSLDGKSGLRDGLILFAMRMVGFRRTLIYFHGWTHAVEQRLRRIPILSHFTRWLLRGAGHIMVLAPEFKQGLTAMGVDAASVTFTRTMFDGAPISEAEKNLAPAPRRSILYMSRFVREKGVHELIDAFARIASDYPDVDLIFGGDGAEAKAMRERVAAHKLNDRVQFKGYVRGADKYALLCNCTLFALPTYFPEGMPVALLEAMGAGKPLLTSPAGGIRYHITDPENGVVLKSVTAATVEEGLRRLLGDADFAGRTGSHNREYAWKRFESAIVTAEIEAVYDVIAARQ